MKTNQLALLTLQFLFKASATYFNLFESPTSVFCSVGDLLVSTNAQIQASQAAAFNFDSLSGRIIDSNNKILCRKNAGPSGASYLSFVNCDEIKANKLIWIPATFDLVTPTSGQPYFAPKDQRNWISCGSRGYALCSDDMPSSNGNAADDCVQKTMFARPLPVDDTTKSSLSVLPAATQDLLVGIEQTTQYTVPNSVLHYITRTTTMSIAYHFPTAPAETQIHDQNLFASIEQFATGTPQYLRTVDIPNTVDTSETIDTPDNLATSNAGITSKTESSVMSITQSIQIPRPTPSIYSSHPSSGSVKHSSAITSIIPRTEVMTTTTSTSSSIDSIISPAVLKLTQNLLASVDSTSLDKEVTGTVTTIYDSLPSAVISKAFSTATITIPTGLVTNIQPSDYDNTSVAQTNTLHAMSIDNFASSALKSQSTRTLSPVTTSTLTMSLAPQNLVIDLGNTSEVLVSMNDVTAAHTVLLHASVTTIESRQPSTFTRLLTKTTTVNFIITPSLPVQPTTQKATDIMTTTTTTIIIEPSAIVTFEEPLSGTISSSKVTAAVSTSTTLLNAMPWSNTTLVTEMAAVTTVAASVPYSPTSEATQDPVIQAPSNVSNTTTTAQTPQTSVDSFASSSSSWTLQCASVSMTTLLTFLYTTFA
ncbi:protein of unknown function [Taphrina deformans PYCC 5710]|uniref:Uncharacterized protein n=1 Tax=Taphrina deformans (strain PYCC 5710 / ATCC 11124 / CBS 356.35 / IMI 108563 / JCM 9778 / NBRC 8474) TaxID=1097556 RepID=R4XKB0_TAPDE|nr:protein of unknown function [Taphrina deformans PYCC 5710]|eukprot:CCG83754.1 protein of unknown function [Taphrina deformans PYCC 5710]